MGDEERIDDLVGRLTTAEKAAMVSGRTFWIVPGCARLGIPEWTVSDGPVGVRGRGRGPGLVVPCPSALAATWDVDLVEQVGAALGREARDRNVQLVLAPTVNLHRVPQGGRHFECFSEDPVLTARMAVAYIEGLQAQGVGACVKHFVANDQEVDRFTVDVRVDETVLRELYLVPFEAAVVEAGARSVMGAYNFVDGVQACEHDALLVDLLKGEWGFDGVVVTDWGALQGTVAPARSGCDLEMPGPGVWWGDGRLLAAVEAGDVAEAALDDKVRRIVRFLDWCGVLGRPTDHDEASVNRPEDRDLARRAAAASMVLAKNEGGLLPLDGAGLRSVAVIGPGAAETAMLGGGSANLVPHRATNALDALRARVGDGVVLHAPGVSLRRSAPDLPAEWVPDGVRVELCDGGLDGPVVEVRHRPRPRLMLMGERWPTGVEHLGVRLQMTVRVGAGGPYRLQAASNGDARLLVDGAVVADNAVDPVMVGLGMAVGTGSVVLDAGRAHDMVVEVVAPPGGGARMLSVRVGAEPSADDAGRLLAEAEAAARAADVAVVVVGSNAEWESEGDDRDGLDLPAGQDELVRRVRAANPRTVVVLNCGAPMLLPWFDDVPSVLLAWYPGQEGGEAIADVLLGDADPGGRMPTTWPAGVADVPATATPVDGVLSYDEGLFVGYRAYDARGVEPQLAFGEGGSYATFAWGSPQLAGTWPEVAVEVPVTNTSARAGREVVQVYVARPEGAAERVSASRPLRALGGFAALTLGAGETRLARVALGPSAFRRWDPDAATWVVDGGRYTLHVGRSSRRFESAVVVDVPASAGPAPIT